MGSSTIETVLVTGSNGAIGRAAVAAFVDADYRVVTFDRDPGERPGAVEHYRGDLLNPETVDSAVDESDADAVVHLGTLPNPEEWPGHETYGSNAMTTYHLLEAAADHEVERVAVASSINAIGGCFQEAPMDVEYLPVDEDHPTTPRDPYALGKRTLELQAAGFGRAVGPPTAVATIRFPWVGDREELRRRLVESDRTLDGITDGSYATRDDLFAYLAREDAARALRAAVEAEFEGHETVFATAADTDMQTPTERLVAECYPDADADDLSGTDALVSTEKARRLLDWEPTVSWRDLDSEEPAGFTPEVTGTAQREAQD